MKMSMACDRVGSTRRALKVVVPLCTRGMIGAKVNF